MNSSLVLHPQLGAEWFTNLGQELLLSEGSQFNQSHAETFFREVDDGV